VRRSRWKNKLDIRERRPFGYIVGKDTQDVILSRLKKAKCMSVATPFVPAALPNTAAVPTDYIWRLSLGQYHEMIRVGILTDDDPVELLDGWLVYKMPKNPPHRVATRMLRQALERITPPGWYVDSQEPVTLDNSEPEPDGMVVRGETKQYLDRHPGPQDLALLAEVSDTTLQRDRGSKKRLFARARIPVYWIVNLIDRQIEVYSDPTGPAEQPDYRQRHDYGIKDSVPLLINGQEVGRIAVEEVVP
jgi:Uma2 family endonuclease